MKRLIVPLLLVVAFASCQREELLVPRVSDTSISFVEQGQGSSTAFSEGLGLAALTDNTHIPAQEAEALALSTAAQMREVEGILTKSTLQIASMEVVANNERKPYVATKSGEKAEQGDVYIINFANNQGYVITSADRRVPGVLAYNSYGHLGKEIDNPGQAIMLSYMQKYIEQERENFEKNKETLKVQAQEHLFAQLPKEKQKELIEKGYFDEQGKRVRAKYIEPIIFGCVEENMRLLSHTSETLSKIPPLLKTAWEQSGDYNDKVSLNCGNDQAPVGCVATAVGQLMAYHKKPAVFKGRTMNWEEMNSVKPWSMFSDIDDVTDIAKEDIQHLLARLGDGDLLDMDYECKVSGSTIKEASRTFKKLGYNSSEIHSYSDNLVINQINNKQPVYIRGCSKEIKNKFLGFTIWTSHDDCHAWVLDGYVSLNEKYEYLLFEGCPDKQETTIEQNYPTQLVHHNFGWGEGSTGWFSLGIFNFNAKKAESATYKSNQEDNYKYENKIITLN